jgi:catechol 2,3-dioxygenase-like lactoylglutathione lyase family enzyme
MSLPGLDHVGVAGRDLDRLAMRYERLGFQLTPFAQHSGKLTPDGPTVKFGTGNRCAMLKSGYLELIARVDPTAPANSLDLFLKRYAGIHIVAFSIEDEELALESLQARGFDIAGVAYLERPVDEADPARGIAKFARLPLPADASPEGRLQLIRHLTPELLWREDLLDHPNQVEALEAVVFCVENPDATLARLSKLTGARPRAGRIQLRQGGIMVTDEASLGTIFPNAIVPDLPFIAGAILRTGDGAAAIRDIAHDKGESAIGGFAVHADHAGGASLLFR